MILNGLVIVYNGFMDAQSRRKTITSRVIRNGQHPAYDSDWKKMTPEERMKAVWTLTMLCYGWGKDSPDEPRLQRSVVRIQRPSR